MNIPPEIAMDMLEKLDAVALIDKEGKYIYVSKNWTKLIGKSSNEVINRFAWDVVQDTKIRYTLETKKSILGEIVEINGIKMFTSYLPLMRDNEFFGVFVQVEWKAP